LDRWAYLFTVGFFIVSSVKSQINGIVSKIDKRTVGYKRRLEALQSAPQSIPAMFDRAMASGCAATYVLMDSWFTHAPLITEIISRGLDVIGMVKNDNKRYIVEGNKVDLKKLYLLATPVSSSSKQTILKSIRTHLVPGIPVLVVFVRHRSKKNEWLAVLSTVAHLAKKKLSAFMVCAGTLKFSSNAPNPCYDCKRSSMGVLMI
jgi:hypothetical protein